MVGSGLKFIKHWLQSVRDKSNKQAIELGISNRVGYIYTTVGGQSPGPMSIYMVLRGSYVVGIVPG